MFIVNFQNVRIETIPDPQHPERQILILNYLARQYTLVQVFSLSQLTTAQNLWRHLDEQGKVCLIVKEDLQYSVWTEQILVRSNEIPEAGLERVFRAQLFLIDGLWAEVKELLGTNQAAAFCSDLLVSMPTIKSIKELLALIANALQHKGSMSDRPLSSRQLYTLHQEIYRLGGKYLGKNYTAELLGDLMQELSPQLRQDFQNWLQKQG